MRFRATICCDIWADTKEVAEMKADIIELQLPNSFLVALSRMPHGSKISFTEENPPNTDSLISKGGGK